MSKKKKIILSAVCVAVLFIAVVVVTGSEVIGKFIYRPTEYTIEYMVNGEVYTVEKYTVNDKNITEPRVPYKNGYDGKWEAYSLDNKNLVVNAIYTPTPYRLTFATGQGVVLEFTVDCENKAFVEPAVPEFLDFVGEWEEYSLDNLSSDIVVRALYTSKGATDGILYELAGDEYKVVGYEGDSEEVFIPEYYRSKKVASIASSAFVNKPIIKVTLPSTLKSVEDGAFSGCGRLVEVCNNSELNVVKGSPLYGEVALNALSVISTVEGKTNITYDSGFAFVSDGSKLYLVDYPKNKTDLVLPSIGSRYVVHKNVFKNSDITAVKFSSDVISIAENAFENCSKLETVDFSDATNLNSIGHSAFSNCDRISFLYFNGGLTEISDFAFYSCYNLAKISIPSSFTNLGKFSSTAFSDCTNLVEVENGSTLNLSSVLPASVLHIYNKGEASYISTSSDGFVFYTSPYEKLLVSNVYGDGTATTLTLPTGSDYVLKSNALIGYNGVSELTVPSNVTLESGCLNGFDNLQYLNAYAFDCSLTQLFDGSFVPDTLEKVVISGGMCESAFTDCRSLKTVQLKEGVLSIPYAAFAGCVNLTGVTIPQSVVSVGDYAFNNCTSLSSVIIPSSVKSIGNYAFSGCNNLSNVNLLSNSNLLSIGDYAFENCLIESFEIPSGVTKLGSGAFRKCSSLKALSFSSDSQITELSAYLLSGSGITGINIPSSVTAISNQAFENCNELTTVTFDSDSQLKSIGVSAFRYCANLVLIDLPESLTALDTTSFDGCDNVTTKLNGVVYVDNWAIGYDSQSTFTVLNFKSDTVGVATKAFYQNYFITDVVLNKDMKYICEYAFYGCTRLKRVSGENNLQEIRSRAFYSCSKLTSFTLNQNTRVFDKAFYYVSGFTVYFMGDASQWSSVVIEGSNLALTSGTKKYYSENLPTESPLSDYWRFVNGIETTWNER
ncbi:MAG: leucine-rich repeat protein [Christensenellaceae bacterium]